MHYLSSVFCKVGYFPYKGFPDIPLFNSENEIEQFLYKIKGSTKESLSTILGVANQIVVEDFSPELLKTLNKDISRLKKVSNSSLSFRIPRKKIATYLELGKEYQHWYSETKKLIEQTYPEKDSDVLIKILAVSSTNMSVKGNSKIFKEVVEGIDTGTLDTTKRPLITKQLDIILQGGDVPGPKIQQYYKAISGDTKAVTVDTWIGRAFDIHRKWKNYTGSLSPLDHLLVRYYVRTHAPKYGLTPAEMTVMIWRGIRIQEKQSLKDYKDYLK